jgi:hypothetical protein
LGEKQTPCQISKTHSNQPLSDTKMAVGRALAALFRSQRQYLTGKTAQKMAAFGQLRT